MHFRYPNLELSYSYLCNYQFKNLFNLIFGTTRIGVLFLIIKILQSIFLFKKKKEEANDRNNFKMTIKLYIIQ